MAREIRPYSLREFGSSVFLPPDVMQALGEPSGHRQGRLLIWATTARAAYEHAKAVGLGGVVRSSRELAPAMGYDVETLNAAHPWPAGTVLAMARGNGPVVEILSLPDGDGPGVKRHLCVIGHLRRSQGYVFTPADMSLVVTDAMVDAARTVIHETTWQEVGTDLLRTAIAAALREGGY